MQKWVFLSLWNYLRFDDSSFDVAARSAESHRHESMCVYGKFDANYARDENDDVACDFLKDLCLSPTKEIEKNTRKKSKKKKKKQ